MLQIPLPPDVEEKLRERAKANQSDVVDFATRLLREALVATSVEDMLAPFRAQIEDSDASDAELDDLVEELRGEV